MQRWEVISSLYSTRDQPSNIAFSSGHLYVRLEGYKEKTQIIKELEGMVYEARLKEVTI